MGAEHDAYIERLATDFVFFIEELWVAIGSDKVAPIGDMERDICRFVADSRNPWRGVLAARGVGKTFYGAAGYTAWRLLRDPDTKILIVSKTRSPAARDTGRLIRGWLTNVPFLAHLDPRDNDNVYASDSVYQFDVTGSKDARSPSVLCQGIEGQITGTRAHLVIADDCETGANTKTVAARSDLDTAVQEFCNIAEYGDKEVVYFGTCWHPESVYFKVAKRGFVFQTWPFTYPLPGEQFLNLSPLIARRLRDGTGKPGTCTFSHRYFPDDIAKRMAPGKMNWQMQHQCLCNLSDTARYPIKIHDLVVFPVARDKAPVSIHWGKSNDRGGTTQADIQIVGWEGDKLYGPIMYDPVWAPYTGTKGYLDPSGRGRDLTGLSIVSHLSGLLWVKACYGLPGGGSSEKLDHIAFLCRQHGVRDLYMETNADTLGTYYPLLEAALQRHFLQPGQDLAFPAGWSCSLEPDRATGQKEVRIIQALEPIISSHRLIAHEDCLKPNATEPKENELQWQLAALTRDRGCFREDGKIDSLAGCINKWQYTLRIDPVLAAKASTDLVIDERLAEHRRLVRGMTAAADPPRWFRN